MGERITLSDEPHRLQGPLSARLREIGRGFRDVQTAGQGITQEDLDRVRGELANGAREAERMEHGRAAASEPINEAVPQVYRSIDEAERLIGKVQRQVVERIREERLDPDQVATGALDAAIAQLVAARASIALADGRDA